MARSSPRNKRRELALAYVGRFATTRARLAAYLTRKVKERGWGGDIPPDAAALAQNFADLHYVDDAGYALMKGAAMVRRGLGPRRIRAGLQADGVVEADRADAEEQARDAQWAAAAALARRKRIGPYALAPADAPLREKQIATFLRAGHDFATARRWVEAAPGEPPERAE
jgi:regulatory protein